MRRLIIGALFGLGALVALSGTPAAAKVPGPNGRIAFAQFEPAVGGTVTYTVNPDGSHVQPLFARGSEFPHWSPDGNQVSIFCCDDGMAAHIVDPDSGSFRELRTARSHARDPLRAMVPGRSATCLRELRHDRPETGTGSTRFARPTAGG